MTVAKSLPHLWQKVRKLLIPKLFLSYSCILGKNKRNSSGTIADDSYGWYMPGISELESAFVQHYVTFDDFHNNFYWSAACGRYRFGVWYEDESKARSTKILFKSDGSPDYVPSSGDDEGAKDRNEELRIRAFFSQKQTNQFVI